MLKIEKDNGINEMINTWLNIFSLVIFIVQNYFSYPPTTSVDSALLCFIAKY